MAGVGVATGAIPDTGGVIHGCYKTGSGQLSVIDTAAGGTCKANETALDWNKTGPQGPKGDTGAQGPRGPSDAFSAAGGTANLAQFSPTTVQTLTLPAGKYVVTAKTVVRNDGSPNDVQCNLTDSAGKLNDASQSSLDTGREAVVPMQGPMSVPGPGTDTVSLTCSGGTGIVGTGEFATSASIDAIQVAKINGS